MSNVKLQEKFTVDAPTDWAWKLLLNVEKVAAFFPGAQLDGHEGGSETEEIIRCRGALIFTVGPLTVEIGGSATLSDIDYYEHSFKLEGTGDEQGGEGGVKFTVLCKLQPIPAVGIEDEEEAAAAEKCTVSITAEAELSGKLSRMERTLFEQAGKSLLAQLREGLCARMAEAKMAYERAPLRSALEGLKDVLDEQEREYEAAQRAAAAAKAAEEQKARDAALSLALSSAGKKSRRSSSITLKLAQLVKPQNGAESGLGRALRRLIGLFRALFQRLGALFTSTEKRPRPG